MKHDNVEIHEDGLIDLEMPDVLELAHFIRPSFACDSKGGDEAVGFA